VAIQQRAETAAGDYMDMDVVASDPRDNPGRLGWTESSLQLAAQCPLAPKLRRDDIMRNEPASLGVGQSSIDLQHDIEVVHDIVEAAIIRQSLQKIPDSLLRREHRGNVPRVPRTSAAMVGVG
jgi:hypothetical protein